MSLMRRMRDITAATINERLERSEDPVRLIDQYLIAQREQLQQSERLYQQCVSHAAALRQQYLTALETKEKREQQAVLALKAGEEQMARIVLQEKLQAEEKSEQYRELYEQAKQSILDLDEQLQQLKADYKEVADKRSYYLARMESARLQQRMNTRLSGIDQHSTPRIFNRIEENVSDMEMQARSLRDVRRMSRESYYPAGNPAVDAELELLRSRLNKEG
ncbi:PspA/IM30 family protein [Paenibacillus sp. GP183]|jgi:phage shock protein A|uniref:PspA/IM30 family protein n=1 Tax=Paenibacillus sp. GP183 TaxID=1882751 RepID=UPI00089D0DC4|nr:PspA/IM30 family protein [Paenibacillus sp. GP183]SEC50880.1 phage shock protein A (PspA) family protein [Paenibacillus sp. GP183]